MGLDNSRVAASDCNTVCGLKGSWTEEGSSEINSAEEGINYYDN